MKIVPNSFVLYAYLQVVNDLVSCRFNWFRLISDFLRRVLRNTYCFIIAKETWYFAYALSILVQTETNIVFNK